MDEATIHRDGSHNECLPGATRRTKGKKRREREREEKRKEREKERWEKERGVKKRKRAAL